MTGPIKVMDIELSLPVTEIYRLGKYKALQALARLHGRPLGWAALPVTRGCCGATDIIEAIRGSLGRHLVREGFPPGLPCHMTSEGWATDEIPTFPSMEDKGPLPLVTVVICTRGRAQNLGMCLKAIEGLTYPRLDILLIDNAPRTDTVERLVKREFPGVRYIVEHRPGLDWARNRAITEARGDIIAFTDDDVVVDSGWIEALVKAFTHDPHIMAATGLVVPYELETEAQILFETYGGFGKGFKRKKMPMHNRTRRCTWFHLATGDLGTGANMAFRRSIFDRIGGFDPALDTGTATRGGGDLEIFFRVIQEGYTLVYEPDAMVRHIHRREYSELKIQIKGWGTAFVAFLARSAMAYPEARPMILLFMVRWFIGRHLIRMLKHLWGPTRIPFDLMMTELTGSLSGLFAYQRARRGAKKIEADLGPIG